MKSSTSKTGPKSLNVEFQVVESKILKIIHACVYGPILFTFRHVRMTNKRCRWRTRPHDISQAKLRRFKKRLFVGKLLWFCVFACKHVMDSRATQQCNVHAPLYFCILLAATSHAVQRSYRPENAIDWLG